MRTEDSELDPFDDNDSDWEKVNVEYETEESSGDESVLEEDNVEYELEDSSDDNESATDGINEEIPISLASDASLSQ